MCMGQRSGTIIKGFKIPKNSYDVWISYFEDDKYITECYSTSKMVEISDETLKTMTDSYWIANNLVYNGD